MSEMSRRNFIKGAALGAVTLSAGGVLAGCTKESSVPSEASKAAVGEVLSPTKVFDAKTGHNFSPEPKSATKVGSTLENLKSAVQGETNATTKYAQWATVADKEGYSQIARLFKATSDAEKIHIALEMALIQKHDKGYKQPAPEKADSYASDINVIHGAQGEIYETSDMYPSFIAAAQKEGQTEAVGVFTRAKLAEAYHAQHYLEAYNTIDAPSKDTYYLCPVCGYIHKGDAFTACPICLTKRDQFKSY